MERGSVERKSIKAARKERVGGKVQDPRVMRIDTETRLRHSLPECC